MYGVYGPPELKKFGLSQLFVQSPQSGFTKSLTGTITPAGAVSHSVGSSGFTVSGTITPAGALFEMSVGIEDFGGHITPNGSLSFSTTMQSVYIVGAVIYMEGNLQPFNIGVGFTGTITPFGLLSLPTLYKVVSGSITPAGAVIDNVVGEYTPGAGADDDRRRIIKLI